jgi:hypothetical protein
MQFAHTLGAGGPEIEFLIVAVAMLVLGIVFFIQKSVKPAVPVILVVGAFAMTAGAFAAGGSDDSSAGSSDEISISIASPEDGSTVPAGEPVTVEVALEGAPEGGHFDVRVDGDIATMTPESNPQVTFDAGEHVLSVEYVNARHQSFDPPVDTEITVTAE